MRYLKLHEVGAFRFLQAGPTMPQAGKVKDAAGWPQTPQTYSALQTYFILVCYSCTNDSTFYQVSGKSVEWLGRGLGCGLPIIRSLKASYKDPYLRYKGP